MASKRRRPGEGAVFRYGDGWRGVIDLGHRVGDDGVRRRVRKTVTARTEREVVQKIRALTRDAEAGIIPSNATVEQWMRHWLDNIAAADLKPSTVVGYRGAIDRYIVPILGTKRVGKLTPDDVRSMHVTLAGWKVQRTGQPLSATTIRHAHATLSKALAVALREGQVARNVAQIAGAPAAAKNPHPILTVDEVRKVMAIAKGDPRLRCRLICAMYLGLRQGEALGLHWADVHLDGRSGWLSVQATEQQIRGLGMVSGTPKSARSVRVVPLPALAVEAFTGWREASGGRGYVFPGHKGPTSPEGSRRDYQAWRDALAAAGVPAVPLHGARGSAATMLLGLGIPDRWIADILGHSQVRTSQEHYLRSDEAQRLAALDKLAGALEAGNDEKPPHPQGARGQ